MKLDSFLGITNDYKHKIVTILGIKLKFRRRMFLRFMELKNNLKTYVSSEIFVANCIKEMHGKTFPKYKNCHYDDAVVLCGTGPTYSYYKNMPNVIQIAVNRAYKREDIKFDYLFVVDYTGTNLENIDEIVNYPAHIFLGTYFTVDRNVRTHSIPMKYKDLPHINNYAIDIPRNLCYPYLECFGLMDYGSVIFNAAHFATYTHPQKIYLVGCDCVNTGHFDNSPPYNDINVDRIYAGWLKFKEYVSVYYPDIEIISINPVGLKGMFKDVYTQSYVDKHPELLNEDIEILDSKELIGAK